MPRRLLTQPSEGAANDGLDNADGNLICRVHDVLESAASAASSSRATERHSSGTSNDGAGAAAGAEPARLTSGLGASLGLGSGARYVVLDNLGQGTFGQVFRCQEAETKRMVAVKVVKNKPAYTQQAWVEVQVTRLLNEKFDEADQRHIVRLLDVFECKSHLCLVFELLSINLYELLKQNQFRGLPLPAIRMFLRQILAAMAAMEDAHVIHCDLKPENILLQTAATGASGHTAPPAPVARGSPPPASRRRAPRALCAMSGGGTDACRTP